MLLIERTPAKFAPNFEHNKHAIGIHAYLTDAKGR